MNDVPTIAAVYDTGTVHGGKKKYDEDDVLVLNECRRLHKTRKCRQLTLTMANYELQLRPHN